jgi:CO/xanthine dehydrogenase FAD-binding subunit
MKPAAFAYLRPATLDAALAALAKYGEEGKILAGGQSLVPLLNFRMLRPAALIDINRISGLDYVVAGADGRLEVGALTRHRTLETSPVVRGRFPVLAAGLAHVAHLAIRNRGTIGGSVSHADPAAELPMLALLLDAQIAIRGLAGTRALAARDFLVGTLTTALAVDEIVTQVTFPPLPAGAGWSFEEFAQRSGDFAIVGVSAVLWVRDGRCVEARIALMGVDETAIRASQAERLLVGERYDLDLVRAAATDARAAISPNSDLRASAEYRRHLVAVLTERVLVAAWRRAEGRPA